MASKDVRTNIEVTADTKQATSALGDVETAAKDAEDAAKKISDTDISVDTSDAVGDLGKIESGAGDAESAIKAVGDVPVTVETSSARQDINDLLAEMHQIREEGAKPIEVDVETGGAVQDVDKLHDSADQSKSVLANMVGNSTQDIAQLGGVAGTAGVALGQLGEYATEGHVSLAGLAGTAVPLLAVTAAVKGISGHMQKIAEIKAFKTDEVDAFTKSIQEGATAQEALIARLRDTGELIVQVFSDNVDLTPVFASLGLTVEDFGRLVTGTKEQTDAWKQSMLDAGANANAVDLVLQSAAQHADLLGKAEEQAAVQTKIFGDTAKDANVVIDDQIDFTKELIDALQGQADAHQATADAMKAQVDAQRGAADSTFALHKAEADFHDQQLKVNDELAKAKDLMEARSILDDYAQSAGGVADAQVRVAQDTATANGTILSQTASTDIWNQSMIDAAATMDGPQRDAILEYIANVNGIPPEKVSDIKALIDAGKIDEAEQLLNDTSRTRDAAIVADAQTTQAEADLNALARARKAEIRVQVLADTNARRNAAAGIVTPGSTDAEPGATSFSIRSAPSFTGVGVPTIGTVVINMPRTADGQSVTRALSNWARVDGQQP